MVKRRFSNEERLGCVEKLAVSVGVFIATYLHISSDRFVKIINYLPEGKVQIIYVYFILILFFTTLTLTMLYFTLVTSTVVDEWLDYFRKLLNRFASKLPVVAARITNIYNKVHNWVKPLWKFRDLFFILIAFLVARIILPEPWNEKVDGIAMLVIAGLIVGFIKSRIRRI